MKSWLSQPHVAELLKSLYADSAANDPINRQAANAPGVEHTRDSFYKAMSGVYMAVGSDFGNLLYALARSTRAKNIVEFGTSFGVSTIYLAAALKDNGGGKLITTEFHEEKVARAKKNIEAAGLTEFVEFRIGDATESLKSDLPQEVDLLFLDGPKDLYLNVLKIVEPRLRSSGILASDNTDHSGLEAFLQYIRDTKNGYTSAPILTKRGERQSGHEVTIRH